MNMPMCSRCKKTSRWCSSPKSRDRIRPPRRVCASSAHANWVSSRSTTSWSKWVSPRTTSKRSPVRSAPLSDLNDLVPAGSGRHGRRRTHETDPVAAGTSAGAARRQLSGGDPHPFFPQGGQKRKYLNNYCENLTQKAAEGRIDHIVGRDRETDRVIQILNRRQKNNPCLIGEPGVGKTAVAEGLAVRINEGRIPFKMRNKEVHLPRPDCSRGGHAIPRPV